MMSKTTEVIIDIKPLSANKIWQGRRYKTYEYQKYEKKFLSLLPEKEQIDGKVGINLTFFLHYPQRCDIDNFFKAVLDILQKRKYIKDDRNIYYLEGHKIKTSKDVPEKIKIIIFEFVEPKKDE